VKHSGATLPTEVWSLGDRFAYDDQGETPNTQMAVFEYDVAGSSIRLETASTESGISKHRSQPGYGRLVNRKS
jgi:hypothetical protein